MSDNASRLLFAGMLAIAAAILLGQGFYAVAPLGAGPGAAVVNKLTGTVRICSPQGCNLPKDTHLDE